MKVGIRSALLLFCSGIAAGAHAQANAQESASEADTLQGESDIVVTALKRSSNIQDVAAAITAISGDTLERAAITDVRSLTKLAPSLVVGEQFGTTFVNIRGVGSNVDSGVTEPTVALYVDGVYLPRSDMATLRMVDLERVEVLRGPQGTLYGRNATGGAINFISAAPSRELTGRVTLSTGSRDAYGITGFVSGPLSDAAEIRISGGYERQDGFVKVVNTGQTLGGVNALYGRVALRARLTDTLTVDLTARYDRNRAPIPYQLYTPSPIAPPSQQTNEPFRIFADYPFGRNNQTSIFSGVVNWDISDSVTLRSTTGYVHHNGHVSVDADVTSVPFYFTPDYDRPSRALSQEITISGETSSLKWLVGVFGFHENAGATLPTQLAAAAAAAFGLPTDTIISSGLKSRIRNVALYGDATWSFTDALRLNLGLRYNHERNEYDQEFSLLPVSPGFSTPFRSKSDKLLPKVALQLDLAPEVNTYVQWSRGYKSGGGNLPGGDGSILPMYLPETIDAFEFGLKSQLFDRMLTANFAAFYYKYDGLQLTDTILPSTTVVQNSDARIYGLEADFRFQPSRAFTLVVSPSYLHARYKDFRPVNPITGLVADLDGEPLTRAPDWTVNASMSYKVPLGDGFLSSLTFEANALYNSSTVLRQYNSGPVDRQSAYALLGGSVTLADRDEKTSLSVFVSNLTDRLYKQNVSNFGNGSIGTYGEPRTWGVRLSRKF